LAIPGSQIEKTLQKYCKHIFILTGSQQFPYQFFGSGTAIKVDDRYFVFCCGHQIDRFAPEQVAIFQQATNETFTGSNLIKTTITEANKDTDIIDVRAMEFVVGNYHIPNLSHQFFESARGKNVWPQNFDQHFIV
jgi:hypothetical protein